jgi:hypothetical protein
MREEEEMYLEIKRKRNMIKMQGKSVGEERGGKGGSVSVLITKKRKNKRRKKCAMPHLYNCSWIDDNTTRSWAFSVALWCTQCQDVTLSGSLYTGK